MEVSYPVSGLANKLTELTTTYNLIQQRHLELVKSFSDLETGKDGSLAKAKEKASMFKITATAMVQGITCIPAIERGVAYWEGVVMKGMVYEWGGGTDYRYRYM